MTSRTTGSPHVGVLSEDDWVPQNTRTRSVAVYGCLVLSSVGIIVTLFVALFEPSMGVIAVGSTVASVAFLLAARQLIVKFHVVQGNLETIFHVSTAYWDPGAIVSLTAAKGARWRRILLQRPSAVYFFKLRPTLKHLKQQDLAGAKDAVRFLYEMEPKPAISLYLQRGAASMVHHDLPVRVVSRQEISF